jgi:ADP-ribose pyrophosphatase
MTKQTAGVTLGIAPVSVQSDRPTPFEQYRTLQASHPQLFRNPDGCLMPIHTDVAGMEAARREIAARYDDAGWPAGWADAGLYYEDPWFVLVRDIISRSDGTAATHHRIILKGSSDSVVIAPRMGDQYVLLRHYRHALRDFSLEFPRGRLDPEDSPEDAVRRELVEEIGAETGELAYLGYVQSDTSLVDNRMFAYCANIRSLGTPSHEEGIESTTLVSGTDIRQMILDGALTDATTVNAFALLMLRGMA